MLINLIGGPLAGQGLDVPPDEHTGEPPEVILAGDPDAPTPYLRNRVNDPLNHTWWWAYIAHRKYDATQEEIEATRP